GESQQERAAQIEWCLAVENELRGASIVRAERRTNDRAGGKRYFLRLEVLAGRQRACGRGGGDDRAFLQPMSAPSEDNLGTDAVAESAACVIAVGGIDVRDRLVVPPEFSIFDEDFTGIVST